MSDTYQAIYDAIRSALRNTDVGSAIKEACHFDASFQIEQVKQAFIETASEMARPSVLYRPELTLGNFVWRAEYSSFVGVGDTPAEAMADFDKRWNNKC